MAVIEFLRWYQTGAEMVRCAGDSGCGALLLSGDTETHQKWHEATERSGD